MHPRLKELYGLISNVEKSKILDLEILHCLKNYGATRTEAAILLHLGFGVTAKDADDFVIKSAIWEPEDINDVFYQTLKYLGYKENDPNYEDDGDKIRISI